jgi:phosphopantothenoylcysteine decarboxylase/phosphopantothenate--cysteine ligase
MGEPNARPLEGLEVLVSAGPTREHFDPVRVLTNPSTGKMGYAVAEAAAHMGAAVTLVSGPTELVAPSGVEVVRVVDAEAMRRAMLERAPAADIVVMAAAVSDFRPISRSDEKLAKTDDGGLTIELERTADILEEIGALSGERTVVGFAAETSDLEERARHKLERKGCDVIVANRVGGAGVGFAADTNEVVILDRHGTRAAVGPASKQDVAVAVLEAVIAYRSGVAVASPENAG